MKQDVERCDCPYCNSSDDIPTVSIHYVLHRLQDVVTDGDSLVEFILELEHNANVGRNIK
jgi:hypothetical protein